MDSGTPVTTLSRRTALRAGALAAGLSVTGLAASRSARARADESVTVATRNLGLGANLFALFFVRSEDELAETVGTLYRDVRASSVPERMAAVADELATHEPDIVGVQEAALVRTDDSAEATSLGETNADHVVVDFLAELTATLAERGAPYEVAQVTTNADAEFPAATDDGRLDVRLTDRDAVLVREGADVSVESASQTHFDAALEMPVDGETYRLERGYGVVRATVRGRDVSVVNTHLESASERVRNAQATQLEETLSSLDDPLVVLGDLNDSPEYGGGAYETLSADFTDAWATARPDDAGYTCCQDPTLGNERSLLDERVDHVLVRGGPTPAEAVLVGASPSDRVDGSDGRTLWPSDHAGVIATLQWRADGSGSVRERTASADEAASGTATPTNRTAAPTRTEDPRNETAANETAANGTANATRGAANDSGAAGPGSEVTSDAEAPGFGPVAGLAGVVGGVAALVRRTRRGGDD
ncbi:endonuclease/exonuclease/phosphatase family protein [Halopelagius longus]|uniref:Endonuclease/Exonuclease/phosphatase family protein n=1 Tax=Halopelagius longus TaxID=1236180 RepID=A0A1H1DKD0_9EURY|nr:endonuclease/exonuclease/phosphatase family protein [Halopelagius longus]RDI71370.1 hypothetical protein DWB78_06300 [Halopelagius longus]SDQ76965.1 Endonuclease/Exonuclease/phosphatase family protein [Halopelagius longus]